MITILDKIILFTLKNKKKHSYQIFNKRVAIPYCTQQDERQRCLSMIDDFEDPVTDVKKIPEKYWKDRDFVLEAVKKCGELLEYAVNFNNDKEIIEAAINQNSYAFTYVNQEFPEYVDLAIAAYNEIENHDDFPDFLCNKKKFVLAAIKSDYDAYEDTHDELKKDADVVRLAIQSGYSKVLQYINDESQQKELLLEYPNHVSFEYASDALKNDKNILRKLILEHNVIDAIKFAHEDIKVDIEFLAELFKEKHLRDVSKVESLYSESPCFVEINSPRLFIERMTSVLKKLEAPVHCFSKKDLYDPDKIPVLSDSETPVFLFLSVDELSPDLNQVFESSQWEFEVGKSTKLSPNVRLIVVGDKDTPKSSDDIRSRMAYRVYNTVISYSCIQELEKGVLQTEGVLQKFPVEMPITMQPFHSVICPLELAKLNFSSSLNAASNKSPIVILSGEEVRGLEQDDRVYYLCSTMTKPVNCIKLSEQHENSIVLFQGSNNIELDILNARAGLSCKNEEISILIPKQKNPYLYEYVYKDGEKWYCKWQNESHMVKDVVFYDLNQCELSKFSTPSAPFFSERQYKKSELFLNELYSNSVMACTKTGPAKMIFEYMSTFMTSQNSFFGIEGSPGIGKDYLLELYFNILTQTDSSIRFRSITAGSDMSLLAQAKEAINDMHESGKVSQFCLKVSELNLRPSRELVELLLYATQMKIPLKVISTENSKKLGYRFDRDHRLADAYLTLPEFTEEDYIEIVKKMWGNHQTFLLDIKKVVEMHLEYVRICKNKPTLRQLDFFVRYLKNPSKKYKDIYGLYESIKHLNKRNFLIDQPRTLDRETIVDLKSQDMSQTPGEQYTETRWAVMEKFRTNVAFRMPAQTDKVTFVVPNKLNIPLPDSAQYITTLCKPGETIELCYLPDFKDEIQVFAFYSRKKLLVGIKQQESTIKSGKFTNIYQRDLHVACISYNPIPLLSDHLDSLPKTSHQEYPAIEAVLTHQEILLIQEFFNYLGIKIEKTFQNSLLQALGIYSDCITISDLLIGLVDFFNGFSDTHFMKTPYCEGVDEMHKKLLFSMINKAGVCRHQTQLIEIFAKLFGIQNQNIVNSNHAFNIITIEEHKYIMDISYFSHNNKKGLKRYSEIKSFFEERRDPPIDKRLADYVRSPHNLSEEELEAIDMMFKTNSELIIKLEEENKELIEAFRFIRNETNMFMIEKCNRYNCLDLTTKEGILCANQLKKEIIDYYRSQKLKVRELIEMQEDLTVMSKVPTTMQEVPTAMQEVPTVMSIICCTFESISSIIKTRKESRPDQKKQKEKFPFTIDQIFNAIQQGNHNLWEWLEISKESSIEIQAPIIQAVGLFIIDNFPKQIEECLISVPKVNAPLYGRVSNNHIGVDGTEMAMIKILRPVSTSKATAIYANAILAQEAPYEPKENIYYLDEHLIPQSYKAPTKMDTLHIKSQGNTFTPVQLKYLNFIFKSNGLPHLIT